MTDTATRPCYAPFAIAPTLAVAMASSDYTVAALVLLTAAAETITADKEAQRHRQAHQAPQATARRPARQH